MLQVVRRFMEKAVRAGQSVCRMLAGVTFPGRHLSGGWGTRREGGRLREVERKLTAWDMVTRACCIGGESSGEGDIGCGHGSECRILGLKVLTDSPRAGPRHLESRHELTAKVLGECGGT